MLHDTRDLQRIAKENGADYKVISRRVRECGWTIERALREPISRRRISATLEDALRDGVTAGDPGECWLWTKGVGNRGHGYFSFKARKYWPHRVAWELVNGPRPTGTVMLHSCENLICCNPAHVYPATPSERNTRSARVKGRLWLTVTDVQDIRAEYAAGGTTYSKLGVYYDVTPGTIAKIVRRQTWQHVKERAPNE